MTYLQIYELLHSESFSDKTKVTDEDDRDKVQKMIAFRNSKRLIIIDIYSECTQQPYRTSQTLLEWCIEQDSINK